MGSSTNSPVDAAMQKVKNAENSLKSAKASRDAAKANGNYKNAVKNCRRHDGKVGNVYDNNVWTFEESLKRAKKELAEAKKRK